MLEDLTVFAFFSHVAGGVVGLLSGILAMTAAKGARVHRLAGNIFFGSMLIMSAFAVYLGFVRPGEQVNIFIGVFVAYLVATAWITIRRPDGVIGVSEKICCLCGLILCAPFLLLSLQLALGEPPFFHSAMAFKGPLLIAIYLFTLILVIAAASDVRMLFAGGVSGAARVARHLWRMCVALTLATGSALSNGLPRLLPPAYQLPHWTLFLQLIWVALLVYWLVRVRVMGWAK